MTKLKKTTSKITLRLKKGVFPWSKQNENALTLSGLRMEASIKKSGSTLGAGVMAMRVWGMRQDHMNIFSTDSLNAFAVRGDDIILHVGYEGEGIYQVFQGTVLEGSISYNSAPDVSFDIFAQSGYSAVTAKGTGNSTNGSLDVARKMEAIASTVGLNFKNNGVTTKLSNQYLNGSPWQQLQTLVDASGIAAVVEHGCLHIWPERGIRDELVIPISAETGMIGYPALKSPGVLVQTRFNPELAYGRMVDLKSTVKSANGRLKIFSLAHEVSTQIPNGPWRSSMFLSKNNVFSRNMQHY